MALRRGFKAESERLARDIWREMRLESGSPMDPEKLAEHLGHVVRPAAALVDSAKLKELYELQEDAFYACTFELRNGRYAIVFNPLMPPERRRSDVAHEVAHLVLDHRLTRLHRLGEVPFRSCDKEQEEEANWLAGCLLLPRFALFHDLRSGKKASGIARDRGLSPKMVDYRLRVTGVERQLAASARQGY